MFYGSLRGLAMQAIEYLVRPGSRRGGIRKPPRAQGLQTIEIVGKTRRKPQANFYHRLIYQLCRAACRALKYAMLGQNATPKTGRCVSDSSSCQGPNSLGQAPAFVGSPNRGSAPSACRRMTHGPVGLVVTSPSWVVALKKFGVRPLGLTATGDSGRQYVVSRSSGGPGSFITEV